MDFRTIATALLALIYGLAPLPAQEGETPQPPAPPAPAAELATPAEEAAPAEQAPEAEAPAEQAEAPVGHPFVETGFYPAWSKMTAEAARADVQHALDLARARQEAICAVEPGQETWENVFLAMDESDREVDNVMSYLIHIFQVANTWEMRKAQEELMSTISAFFLEVTGNERLWQVIKRASEQPWVQELSPEKKYYVQCIVNTFRDSGADLPAEKKAYLQEAMAELVKLQLQFDQNCEKSAYRWEAVIRDRKKLDGMPAAWMKENASGKLWGRRWLLTISDVETVLANCTVEETRKRCWEGLNSIGNAKGYNNAPVVARIMELRQSVADTIGFKHFADMVCKERMVSTGDQALGFVDGMMDRLLPAYRREQQELLEFASEYTGTKVEAIHPWDYKFYQTQLAKKHSDLDTEALRPYLRSDRVFQGMLATAAKLYDIRFQEVPSACTRGVQDLPEGAVEVWDEDVKVYKVTDNKTGRHLGSFYYDPYSHNGKQGGAWTQALRPGLGGQPHLVAVMCNFPAPGAKGYSLLSMREVETIFHEFGHALHGLFCETDLALFAMRNVKPDFAELPSQFFERYCWEPEVLATYAFHHETGEPLPADLAAQLRQHQDFHPATQAMDMLAKSKLDLEMHMHYAQKFAGKTLDDATAEILAPWAAPLTQPAATEIRYFSHCISKGYAAGYFSYSWTEVLAADVFARFKKEGIFNPETAGAFRNSLLKPACSRPAADLYRDFMGRDPNPDALMVNPGGMGDEG